MVSWTVMFGEVVGEVDSTECPEHVELALVNAIAKWILLSWQQGSKIIKRIHFRHRQNHQERNVLCCRGGDRGTLLKCQTQHPYCI
jgi:hypothetical protein